LSVRSRVAVRGAHRSRTGAMQNFGERRRERRHEEVRKHFTALPPAFTYLQNVVRPIPNVLRMPETAKDLSAAILSSVWASLAVSAFGPPPTFPLLLAAWSPACVLSLDNFPLKFGKRSEDMKDEFSTRSCCIDVLPKRFKPYSPITKFGYRVIEVAKRPSGPVKPPDEKRISLSKVAESPSKAFPFRFGRERYPPQGEVCGQARPQIAQRRAAARPGRNGRKKALEGRPRPPH
jgi:hypothetical protein